MILRHFSRFLRFLGFLDFFWDFWNFSQIFKISLKNVTKIFLSYLLLDAGNNTTERYFHWNSSLSSQNISNLILISRKFWNWFCWFIGCPKQSSRFYTIFHAYCDLIFFSISIWPQVVQRKHIIYSTSRVTWGSKQKMTKWDLGEGAKHRDFRNDIHFLHGTILL